jgi:hypothetical protein
MVEGKISVSSKNKIRIFNIKNLRSLNLSNPRPLQEIYLIVLTRKMHISNSITRSFRNITVPNSLKDAHLNRSFLMNKLTNEH